MLGTLTMPASHEQDEKPASGNAGHMSRK